MLEFYSYVKQKIVAQLKWIITNDENFINAIEKANTYFVSLDKPKNLDYGSDKNYIVLARKQFEQLCITLSSSGVQNPHELSVFRFMEIIQFYESKRNAQPKPNHPISAPGRSILPRRKR